MEQKLTRQDEKDNPVNHQNRPEHRNVKNREPRAHETDHDGPGSPVPKLELWKTTDEGAELVILLGRKIGAFAVFQAFVLGEGRVELGLQEEEEEVKEVDSKGIGN